MRNPFHQRSTLEKIVAPVGKVMSPVAGKAPRVVKSGVTAVATFVGLSLASAAVSKARERQNGE
jgi:hypothetical protein